MKTVYICHPYRDNPLGNEAQVREICRDITSSGRNVCPIAPQIYLPQFMDDEEQRELAMDCCLAMLRRCDEVWVYSDRVTEGMRQEIYCAITAEIPVIKRARGTRR